jgi:hypothetical protein
MIPGRCADTLIGADRPSWLKDFGITSGSAYDKPRDTIGAKV